MATLVWNPPNPGPANFADAKNWVQHQVPGPTDDASINGTSGVVTGTGTAYVLIFDTAEVAGQLTAIFGTQVNQALKLHKGATLTTPRLGIPISAQFGGGILTVHEHASVAITPGHAPNSYPVLVGDDAAGTLIVRGVGAIVDGGNQPIAVGEGGPGVMTIGDGGTVTSGNGDPLIYPFAFVVANGTNVAGSVQVSDATLTARGQIVVGRRGPGTLAIDGCSVVCADDMAIGWDATGNGSVSVSGHRARLVVLGGLDIAAACGHGSLEVNDHGLVLVGIGVTVHETLTLNDGLIDTTALALSQGATLTGSGTVTAPSGFDNESGNIVAHGKLTLVGDLTNNGAISVDTGGEFRCDGSLSGQGTVTLQPGATASVAAVAASQTVTFAPGGATLVLRSPGAFTGTIAGFGTGDAIELEMLVGGVTYAGSAVSGVLTVKDSTGTQTIAQLTMQGSYTQNNFKLKPQGVVYQ